MNDKTINVSFIHHSGYMVRSDKRLFIFDFYSGKGSSSEREENQSFVMAALTDPAVEQVFVFASHAHGDHFDPSIFDFPACGKNIHYVFSNDISINPDKIEITYLGADQETELAGVKIHSFGSTDEGVSFLVNTDGLHIFHAGDLNWWYWFYESTPAELAEYEHDFKQIIKKMRGAQIDIAFFPVDPRLMDYSHFGGEYFIDQLKPQIFMPMHFWGDFDSTIAFKIKAKALFDHTKIKTVSHDRQSYELKIKE